MRKKERESDLFDEYYRAIEWESKTTPQYKELEKISELLDEIPHILENIQSDLNYHLKNRKFSKPGRESDITAEQVLRCVILKQLQGFDYRGLASGIDIAPLLPKIHKVLRSKDSAFYYDRESDQKDITGDNGTDK